ncbi:MAG: DUF4091 domain-containing protein [Eubacteriales bacterium]|nr:DUF4091 domain-containing protein [Eubacteriales bacterium]
MKLKYTVVDSSEFTYPDRWAYASSADKAEVFAPRGGYATFQILLDGLPEDGAVEVSAEGFSPEIYSLYPVYVEANQGLNADNALPHYPERWAPYYIYDCLMPYRGKIKVTDGRGGLYIAVKIDAGAQPGVAEGCIKAGGLTVPVKIRVFPAVVPDETLKIIMGYNRGCVADYHNVKQGSAEFNELDDKYLSMLRRMRQNMMYVGGVTIRETGENRYEFDFSVMEANMKKALSFGIKYFNGPSVGWRKSWHESTIYVKGNIPCMSHEGYLYLSQYLPALHAVLERNGWLDIFAMGIADEPNGENATEFRALCGLVRKFVPDIKLIDAMSYGNLHGALDIWVPLNSEYETHRQQMESLRGNGDEIWHYVCCGPRYGGYINRFMDYPLLATRYLYWGNYKYNLGGYLHWAANCYQSGMSADGTAYRQDPFTCNCPEHHNTDSVCFLPPGDTHVIYPGDGEPWMSIRLEAHRESAEEYELFKLLEAADKAKADEICSLAFRSFKDVEYDPIKFRDTRKKLLEAVSAL